MNFNIVEGDYEILSEEEFKEFEIDYLNSELKSNEVRLKHGLSKKQYSIVAQQIRDKYGLLRRPYAQSRHYYRQGKRWIIIKTNSRERIYLGSLPVDVFSKEEVEQIVESCKNLLWDIDKCTEMLEVLCDGSI